MELESLQTTVGKVKFSLSISAVFRAFPEKPQTPLIYLNDPIRSSDEIFMTIGSLGKAGRSAPI